MYNVKARLFYGSAGFSQNTTQLFGFEYKSRPPAKPVACTGPIRAYYQPHLKGALNFFLLHEMLRRY